MSYQGALDMERTLRRLVLSTYFVNLRNYRRSQKRRKNKPKVVILQTAMRRYVKTHNIGILRWAV